MLFLMELSILYLLYLIHRPICFIICPELSIESKLFSFLYLIVKVLMSFIQNGGNWVTRLLLIKENNVVVKAESFSMPFSYCIEIEK